MAFLRVEKKKSGKYLRIIESYRDVQTGQSRQRILYSLGKVEDYEPEQLRRIGAKLYELGGGTLKTLLGIDAAEKGRYNYGYYQVYQKAFSHFGLDRLSTNIQNKHKLKFDFANVLTMMLLERLNTPCSKRSSYFNQGEYLNISPVGLHQLYRTLDKLSDYSDAIQQQIYRTGRNLFNQQLDVVFYDVTTLYFESEKEHEGGIAQKGFGKDGKIGKTQVLFCMLIDRNKQPIGYRLFQGSTYEGHTFEHALADLKDKFWVDKVIVVADRGMLSKVNLQRVRENNYEFIVGERLRSLPTHVKEQLTKLDTYHKEWLYSDSSGKEVGIRYCTIQYMGRTIIGTYSAKRAKKDRIERETRLKKAQQLLRKPASINKNASRYFLKSEKGDNYILDEAKIALDQKYDGFLAIATNNTELAVTEILDQYKQLYKIEQSFRTFKSHLETRPMFHWNRKRIEGHICLCYIAYTLLNYTLLKLQQKGIKTTEKALRKTLDKMQLSLLEHQGKDVYLRSAPSEDESRVQKALGLKPLPNLFPVEAKSQYI